MEKEKQQIELTKLWITSEIKKNIAKYRKIGGLNEYLKKLYLQNNSLFDKTKEFLTEDEIKEFYKNLEENNK